MFYIAFSVVFFTIFSTRHTSPTNYALSIPSPTWRLFIRNPGYLILFTIATSDVSNVKSKSSLPCASSAKLPSGEIADSYVAHGEIFYGTNWGMLICRWQWCRRQNPPLVVMSWRRPVDSPSAISMSNRSTGYPSSDSISIPISGAGVGIFMICRAWVVPDQTLSSFWLQVWVI